MTDATDRADGPPEVEVDVTDGAVFELRELEVDRADRTPRAFVVAGRVDGVERATLRTMRGRGIEPVAVRFEVDDGPATPSERTFRTWCADDEPATATVVRGLAAIEGVEPSELDPLYNHVDPDALDALVGAPGGAGCGAVTVGFAAGRHWVRVRSDGSVAIRAAAEGE